MVYTVVISKIINTMVYTTVSIVVL